MAEAHSAVAFHFSVTSEGILFNVNRNALLPVLKTFLWNAKLSVLRFLRRSLDRLYPLTLATCVVIIALLFGIHQLKGDWSGLVGTYERYTSLVLDEPYNQLVAVFLFSLTAIVVLINVHKYVTKLLLTYHGWMYDPLGKPSRKTKLQFSLLKLLLAKKPSLRSLQPFLPTLPLPKVDDTVHRYLKSVQPWMSNEQYKRVEELASEFLKGPARKLQLFLRLKWLICTNYVSDWWEEYVYLCGRSPIMVNSNYYGLDAVMLEPPTHRPAARAAMSVFLVCKLRENVRAGNHKPIVLQNAVPLCSWQYDRVSDTFRAPGEEKDTIVHRQDSDHVTVYCRGRIYVVKIRDGNRLYNAAELEEAFESILDADVSDITDAEKHLPALTAGDRIPWAQARSRFFSHGLNRASLLAIETSMIFLTFDDKAYSGYDPQDHSKLNEFAKAILHGDCHSRWFDTETMIISSNGRQGFNMEHTSADAPVPREGWEKTIIWETKIGYAPDGRCKGEVVRKVPQPTPLKWEISTELTKVIDSQLEIAQQLASDVDLYIVIFPHGKAMAKKHRVSPDAFIQAALQLAYFRDQSKFCLTYESSMTRLFRNGRTETVRSCTSESVAFVRSFVDENISREQKIDLFRKSCERHQNLYRDAMTGKGVDRHLFTLYVASRYLGIDTPFLKEVLGEPWRLSTSQSPYSLSDPKELRDIDPECKLLGIGGGFGPVSDDGYGVAYMITGENSIGFQISSKISCSTTSSKRFAETIQQALLDIDKLCSK